MAKLDYGKCSNLYFAGVVGRLPLASRAQAATRHRRQTENNNNGRIYVSRADGAYVRLIIGTSVQWPASLAVDPVLSRVYWTDVGHPPKIAYADLDGLRRNELVNSNLMPVGTPTSIAIDYYKRNRVVWVDNMLRGIYAVFPDGSHRVRLAHVDACTCKASFCSFPHFSPTAATRCRRVRGLDLLDVGARRHAHQGAQDGHRQRVRVPLGAEPAGRVPHRAQVS